MLGLFVPHLASKIKPRRATNKNCENVIKFPDPGSSFTNNSKNKTLLQHPVKTKRLMNKTFNIVIKSTKGLVN